MFLPFLAPVIAAMMAIGAPIAAAAAPFGLGAVVTPLAAGIGATGLGAGSLVSGAGSAAGAATNPHITDGIQNASNDAYNNAVGSVANAVNGMNLPGVHVQVN